MSCCKRLVDVYNFSITTILHTPQYSGVDRVVEQMNTPITKQEVTNTGMPPTKRCVVRFESTLPKM